MIKELIKIANELDRRGLRKEADRLDNLFTEEEWIAKLKENPYAEGTHYHPDDAEPHKKPPEPVHAIRYKPRIHPEDTPEEEPVNLGAGKVHHMVTTDGIKIPLVSQEEYNALPYTIQVQINNWKTLSPDEKTELLEYIKKEKEIKEKEIKDFK